MPHTWIVAFFIFAMLMTFQTGLADDAQSDAAIDGPNAVWLYGGICKSEAETIALIEKCKSHGIGALLPSLSAGGDVLWKSDKANYAAENKAEFDAGFDGLESLVRNAHAAGMKVVPSVAVCPGGKILDQHPEWETHDRNGKPSRETAGMAAVSLAYKDARAAKIALLMDLVEGYEVDGVLLDYCRYPENSKAEENIFGFYGYDQPLIDACMNLYGFDPRTAPLRSAEWNVFNAMRAETVSAFVREFRDAAKAARPAIRIAGFGDSVPEVDAAMCGRDYATWAQRGYVDDLFVATYTEKIDQMKAVVEHVRSVVGDKVVLHTALTPFQGFLKTNDEMKRAAEEQLAGDADGLWIYREDFLNQLDLWTGAKLANDLLVGR